MSNKNKIKIEILKIFNIKKSTFQDLLITKKFSFWYINNIILKYIIIYLLFNW